MPHPGLQVEGRCYFCLKQTALNGSRSKLSDEALIFVGFGTDSVPIEPEPRWIPTTVHTYIDQQLEEIARLRDIAPGWYALARRILEEEGQ
jgi:hypothetical protein